MSNVRNLNSRTIVLFVGGNVAKQLESIIVHTGVFASHYVAFRAECIFADFFVPTNQTRLHVSLTATPFAKGERDVNCHGTRLESTTQFFCWKTLETIHTVEKFYVLAWHTILGLFFVCGQAARACSQQNGRRTI